MMKKTALFLFYHAVTTMVVGFGCHEEPEPEPCGPHIIFESDDWAVQDRELRCERFPNLCNLPVVSTINEEDLHKAFDIVFIGDGYRKEQLSDYKDKVDEFTAGLLADENGFVTYNPGLFNFHRVDVVSDTDRLTNSDRNDTALGSCYTYDSEITQNWSSRSIGPFVYLAGRNAPDADAIVVVLNSPIREANAMPRYGSSDFISIVHIPRIYPHGVLTHELGHALFGLGDEYWLIDECYTSYPFSTADSRFEPNLSLDPDAAKWQDIVEGSRPGGDLYADCIYHPTDRCRMHANSDDVPFCPVCKAHIQEMFKVRMDPTYNDGPPGCGLQMSQMPNALSGEVFVILFAIDLNGIESAQLQMDGHSIEGPQGVGISYENQCTFSGEWACNVIKILDTNNWTNGTHLLEYQCSDQLGLVTEQTLEVTILQE